ncbi:MAG: hypothetical protein QW279_08975, partial [Candidatus Jordarchaeaceae archaeon]
MFYYLFNYINETFNPPGFDVFRFLSFRSALSAITALVISFIFGPKIIRILKKHQIDQPIRDDGPKTHKKKAGTPTMGGIIILLSVIVPVLL